MKKPSKSKVSPVGSTSRGDISSKIRVGIVGLPNVGKSSLFNALCRRAQAQAGEWRKLVSPLRQLSLSMLILFSLPLLASENYPFCTIEPNVAQIALPDPYLEPLGNLAKHLKTIPSTIEFIDVAGLVSGASRGEGLGNKVRSM